jgi:glycogen synthase
MSPERYALGGGCDFTLLPSRWEPCGVVQMEAMIMGTLPIVAPTGGLRDTVEDGLKAFWTEELMGVESDVDPVSVASLAKALWRAAEIRVSAPAKISEIRRAAMAAWAEFAWSNAALRYEQLFEELGAIEVLSLSADRTVSLEAAERRSGCSFYGEKKE